MFARSRPGCAEGFLPGPQAASFGSRCSQLPPICRGLRAFVLRTRRPVPGTGREPGCAGRVPPSAPTRPPCSWLGEVAAPLCGVRELGVSVRDGSRAAAERGVPRPWQRFLLPLLAWARVLPKSSSSAPRLLRQAAQLSEVNSVWSQRTGRREAPLPLGPLAKRRVSWGARAVGAMGERGPSNTRLGWGRSLSSLPPAAGTRRKAFGVIRFAFQSGD